MILPKDNRLQAHPETAVKGFVRVLREVPGCKKAGTCPAFFCNAPPQSRRRFRLWKAYSSKAPFTTTLPAAMT